MVKSNRSTSIKIVAMIRKVVILLAVPAFALSQQAFRLGGHAIPAGAGESFELAIETASVPVSVLHGARPGPVLTIAAGTVSRW